MMMGGVITQNMKSSLQKYNKLYIAASCWIIIDISVIFVTGDHFDHLRQAQTDLTTPLRVGLCRDVIIV
jgi:hypothetical protein